MWHLIILYYTCLFYPIYLHVFVPDGYEYAVESLVFATNVELGENHHVLGVDGSVSDPVFLGKRVWGVHDEF